MSGGCDVNELSEQKRVQGGCARMAVVGGFHISDEQVFARESALAWNTAHNRTLRWQVVTAGTIGSQVEVELRG